MEFSIAVFSGRDGSQSAQNVHNVRSGGVVELTVPSSQRPSIVDVVLYQFIRHSCFIVILCPTSNNQK